MTAAMENVGPNRVISCRELLGPLVVVVFGLVAAVVAVVVVVPLKPREPRGGAKSRW